MTIKIGDQFIIVPANQPVIITLSEDDMRDFTSLPDDDSKCIIHDTRSTTEADAIEILRKLK